MTNYKISGNTQMQPTRKNKYHREQNAYKI